jgi:hypothetical protein
VLPLYARELIFKSIGEAIEALSTFEDPGPADCQLLKFEVQLRFSTGDEGTFTFRERSDAIHFLRMFV